MRCWWYRHYWEKWTVIEKGKRVAREDSLGLPMDGKTPIFVGSYEIQRRECVLCGKSQLRKVHS